MKYVQIGIESEDFFKIDDYDYSDDYEPYSDVEDYYEDEILNEYGY